MRNVQCLKTYYKILLSLGIWVSRVIAIFLWQVISQKIIKLSSIEKQKQINYGLENITFINILIDTTIIYGESFLHCIIANLNYPDLFPIEKHSIEW